MVEIFFYTFNLLERYPLVLHRIFDWRKEIGRIVKLKTSDCGILNSQTGFLSFRIVQ